MSFEENKMLIMPAVDIRNGKCVQLVQGKPGSEQVVIDNPEKVALSWQEQGAKTVHIIDLNGTIDGKTSLPTIKKIVNELSVPVQLGGGIRSLEYAKELLDLDIDRVIIGTMGIKHPEVIQELSKEYGSDRIMISLDSKDSKVVIKGWQEKIDKTPEELSNENVDVEGLLNGFYTEPVLNLVNSTDLPVVYSGGVTSTEDLAKLNKTGVKGVVIGSALYKNKINLKDALKYEEVVE